MRKEQTSMIRWMAALSALLLGASATTAAQTPNPWPAGEGPSLIWAPTRLHGRDESAEAESEPARGPEYSAARIRRRAREPATAGAGRAKMDRTLANGGREYTPTHAGCLAGPTSVLLACGTPLPPGHLYQFRQCGALLGTR